MKKLILAVATIAFTAGACALNDSTSDRNSLQDTNNTQGQNEHDNPVDKRHPDGVIMQNGKIMKVKNGKMTSLDKDMTMSNGTKIMNDGTFVKKDGTKMKMKEGQHIDMSGNITFTNENVDRDRNQNRDRNQKDDRNLDGNHNQDRNPDGNRNLNNNEPTTHPNNTTNPN